MREWEKRTTKNISRFTFLRIFLNFSTTFSVSFVFILSKYNDSNDLKIFSEMISVFPVSLFFLLLFHYFFSGSFVREAANAFHPVFETVKNTVVKKLVNKNERIFLSVINWIWNICYKKKRSPARKKKNFDGDDEKEVIQKVH